MSGLRVVAGRVEDAGDWQPFPEEEWPAFFEAMRSVSPDDPVPEAEAREAFGQWRRRKRWPDGVVELAHVDQLYPARFRSFRVVLPMKVRRTWRRRERRRTRGERQVQQLAAELGVTLPAEARGAAEGGLRPER